MICGSLDEKGLDNSNNFGDMIDEKINKVQFCISRKGDCPDSMDMLSVNNDLKLNTGNIVTAEKNETGKIRIYMFHLLPLPTFIFLILTVKKLYKKKFKNFL